MRVLHGRSDAEIRQRAQQVRLVAFDFDGVFTDNTVLVTQDGIEIVRCWRSDGLGLQRLRAAGVETVIISTEANPVVTARSRKLRIPCHQGCEQKLDKLEELAAAHGIGLDAVAFVGNDVNDETCLRAVALPIIVRDAHADVIPHGVLRTDARGGRGAVREVCDFLLAQRQEPGA